MKKRRWARAKRNDFAN